MAREGGVAGPRLTVERKVAGQATIKVSEHGHGCVEVRGLARLPVALVRDHLVNKTQTAKEGVWQGVIGEGRGYSLACYTPLTLLTLSEVERGVYGKRGIW